MQPLEALVRQGDPGAGQELARLVERAAEIGRPQLRQLPGEAETMEAELRVMARGERDPEPMGPLGDEGLELGERLRRRQLVEVVDDEDDRGLQPGKARGEPPHECTGGQHRDPSGRDPTAVQVTVDSWHDFYLACSLAISFTVVAALGLLRIVRRALGLVQAKGRLWTQRDTLRRLTWTFVADVLLLYIAASLASSGDGRWLLALTIVDFVLLIGAADVSWDLLVRESEEARPSGWRRGRGAGRPERSARPDGTRTGHHREVVGDRPPIQSRVHDHPSWPTTDQSARKAGM